MAIKSLADRPRMLHIDLTGPEGNAFVLLGYASSFCKELGYRKDKTERILDEMKLGDYECLLHTFDREFGSFVTLYR